MINQEQYSKGWNAAQRALDNTTMAAAEMRRQASERETLYRADENHSMAEWCRGYVAAVDDFLTDKAH